MSKGATQVGGTASPDGAGKREMLIFHIKNKTH